MQRIEHQPVALKLLNQKLPNGTYLIPTPQRYGFSAAGLPVGFSTYSIPAHFVEDQFLINTDYVLSNKHHLDERYFHSRDPQTLPFSTCAAGCPPGSAVHPDFASHVAVIRLTSALTSSFLNEAVAGFVRSTGTLTTDATIPASTLGITPSDPTYPLIPLITVIVRSAWAEATTMFHALQSTPSRSPTRSPGTTVGRVFARASWEKSNSLTLTIQITIAAVSRFKRSPTCCLA